MDICLVIPFVPAAKQKTESLNINISNPPEELLILIKTALTKIFKKEFKFPETDDKFLQNYFAVYPFARIILSHLNKDRFYALFANFYLSTAKAHIKEPKKALEILEIEYKQTKKHFLIPFQIYIKPKIFSTKDKLTNQKLYKGFVYLNNFDTLNFISRYVAWKVIENLPLDVKNTGADFKKIADDLDRLFKPKQSIIKIISGKIDFNKFPPCMSHILETLVAHGNPKHIERYYLATFLFNLKMEFESILKLFKNTSNYNEKTTKYQLEKVQKYTAPNCNTIKSVGLCYADDFCPYIKSPKGYYYKKQGLKYVEEKRDTN